MGWRWPLLAALGGAGAYGVSAALSQRPELAERWYGSGMGPALSRPLSLLTGLVPFSVGDVVLGAYATWLVVVTVLTLRSLVRRRRSLRNAAGGGLRRVMRDGGLAVLLFYVLWGWHYATPGFEAGAGWPEWEEATTAELVALAQAATAAANRAYVDLHGSADAGRPTVFSDGGTDAVDALSEGWVRTATHLGLPRHFAARYGRVKRPYGSVILVRLGIQGTYFPFTAEANVVRGMPAAGALSSMGHEQAHQRGITSEGEAGFLGFVALALAPGPLARYGAAFEARGRMSSALFRADREAWRRIAATDLAGVRRDEEDLARFYRRATRIGTRVQSAVNDRYLRANRVPGGRANYGLTTRLMIQYARQHGGELLPRPAAADGGSGP